MNRPLCLTRYYLYRPVFTPLLHQAHQCFNHYYRDSVSQQQRCFSTPDFSDLHSFGKFTTAGKNDCEAPVETAEYAKATSNAKDEGKVVHPPGAARQIVRSELYGLKLYDVEGPRDHMDSEGFCFKEGGNKYVNAMKDVHPQKFCSEDGQTYIVGPPDRPVEDLWWDAPTNEKWWKGKVNIPFITRRRMFIFSNYDYIMKTDYFMFWIPTFLIFTITIPTYCMAYMIDELAYTSMTVKVVGRQWYWVYEVESPTDEEEEE